MSINRRSIRAIAPSLWIFHVVYNFSSFTSIQKTVPDTDGKQLYFIAWQDNKPVHMLSTFPAYRTTCKRSVRNPNRSWDTNRIFQQPTSIPIYNSAMGGTDSTDQRIAYYRPNVKCTLSWLPRTFMHIILLCCVNAYIIYYLSYGIDRKLYPYLDFLRDLINELAADQLAKSRNNIEELVPKAKRTVRQWENKESRLRGAHWAKSVIDPHIETLNKEAKTTITRNYVRGKCLLCRKNVDITFEQCQVHLCHRENPTYGMNCFKVFHTEPKLTTD